MTENKNIEKNSQKIQTNILGIGFETIRGYASAAVSQGVIQKVWTSRGRMVYKHLAGAAGAAGQEILWTDPKNDIFLIFWGTKQIKDDAIYHLIVFWWMLFFRFFSIYTRAGGGGSMMVQTWFSESVNLSFYPFGNLHFSWCSLRKVIQTSMHPPLRARLYI